jgi:hypothetical protein
MNGGNAFKGRKGKRIVFASFQREGKITEALWKLIAAPLIFEDGE